MSFNCIIVDDEKLARDLLTEFLEPHRDVEIVAECSNGRDAVEKINELKPELIFLDVQMPGMDGFEVLQALRYKPFVIFTTAYDQYAIKAFDSNAIDYLLKPLDQERFDIAVQRASEQIKTEDVNVEELISTLKGSFTQQAGDFSSHLFVQKSEKLLNLEVDKIMHLEASGDYTVLTTKTDQFLSSTGIGKLEPKLNPGVFIRVHRSTIINLNYLKEIEKHFNGGLIVKMENGKMFTVSRSYSKKIRQKVV